MNKRREIPQAEPAFGALKMCRDKGRPAEMTVRGAEARRVSSRHLADTVQRLACRCYSLGVPHGPELTLLQLPREASTLLLVRIH